MKFESLHVFVTIVDAGGFNAAADALHRSQPAITKSLKNLEDQLEFELFDRSHYRPVLTDKGALFYKRCKALISHWQHIKQFATTLKHDVETDITIAIDILFPLSKLEHLFKRWVEKFPMTHFHFLSETLGGACERLELQQADIIISENLISDQSVEVIPLLSIPMIAVATKQFIHQNFQNLQHLDNMHQCMQVIIRDSSTKDFTFGVIENSQHWTVSSVDSKKQIILADLGWGRLPENVIQKELASGQLQTLEADHFDTRVVQLSGIRLQKPAHGIIAEQLWRDLQDEGVLSLEKYSQS